MKVLIVSDCTTHPTTAGNRRFILDTVEMLQAMGHECHMLYFKKKILRNKTDEDAVADMKKYWGNRITVINQSWWQKIYQMLLVRWRKVTGGFYKCDDDYPCNLHKVINHLNEKYKFEACLVNYFYMSKALKYINIPRKGIITHDYYSFKAMLVGAKRTSHNIKPNEEAKAMQRSPDIFALNEGEAEFFQRLSPQSRVHCIYGSFVHRPTPIVGNHHLLFLSGPNVYNINGLNWFLCDIFPAIKATFPDVELCIGGAICKVLGHLKDYANINLIGIVESSADFFAMGDVAINPTYQGTGLKIKTFEAIAHDKVTLCHPHSKNGIYRKEQSPIFASTSANDWVEFLRRVWRSNDEMLRIKQLNAEYLNDMMKHVRNEYKKFLK